MRKEQEMIEWVKSRAKAVQDNNAAVFEYKEGVRHTADDFLSRFAPKPMTFMEAAEAMKQGKKVRREAWVGFENLNVRFEGNCVRWYDNKGPRNHCVFEVSDFFIADWVLYEEGV